MKHRVKTACLFSVDGSDFAVPDFLTPALLPTPAQNVSLFRFSTLFCLNRYEDDGYMFPPPKCFWGDPSLFVIMKDKVCTILIPALDIVHLHTLICS